MDPKNTRKFSIAIISFEVALGSIVLEISDLIAKNYALARNSNVDRSIAIILMAFGKMSDCDANVLLRLCQGGENSSNRAVGRKDNSNHSAYRFHSQFWLGKIGADSTLAATTFISGVLQSQYSSRQYPGLRLTQF